MSAMFVVGVLVGWASLGTAVIVWLLACASLIDGNYKKSNRASFK